jgi:hypothetical protein
MSENELCLSKDRPRTPWNKVKLIEQTSTADLMTTAGWTIWKKAAPAVD